MANRREKPYLPLYVQDFISDERLRECSAMSVGVYIFVMCLMHKSDEYGAIVLKQRDKQSDNQILNFANKLDKHLPFGLEIIMNSLKELLLNEVLHIKLDTMYQRRMQKDGEISLKRASAGQKGGIKSLGKGKKVAQANDEASDEAKPQANRDIDIDNDIKDNLEVSVLDNTTKSNFIKISEIEKVSKVKIPTLEDFLNYLSSIVPEDEFELIKKSAELKYYSWLQNDWRTNHEKPRLIKNWKTTLLNTIPHLHKDAKKVNSSTSAMEDLMKKHNLNP